MSILSTKEEKLKALSELIKETSSSKKIEAGERLSFLNDKPLDVPKISSGSIVLDNILGGGVAQGRIIEIYGPEGSGKTTVALTVVANVQREGGTAVYLDVEQAFDPRYAKNIGVNTEELVFAQPGVAESTLELAQKLVSSGAVDIIVIDSVAALTPREELDGGLEKVQVALLARLMSKALRLLISECNKNNCTVIFINQVRDNVGMMYGPSTTTPGGKALKFYASQRIEVKKTGTVKDREEVIGTSVRLKVIKNKVAPPFGEATTVLTFAQGINRAAELHTMAVEAGVISKVGNTYYLPINEETQFLLDKGYAKKDDMIKVEVYERAVINKIAEDKELFEYLTKKVIEYIESQKL